MASSADSTAPSCQAGMRETCSPASTMRLVVTSVSLLLLRLLERRYSVGVKVADL